ncbi:MAG: methionine synthase [Cyanobacteria bacterium MAG CAR3_bin_5]|nr:methionine synthase [Cyanobacteria bacterium MAG CAR3_bin_5]
MARSAADVASAFLQRLHGPERPVLVFDGGTGTSLQRHDLTARDFGGPELEGCNEHLVFTRPDVVQAVHRSFLEVGCDVIETNTFGATPLVLGEYGLADQAYAINRRGAELAAETASEFSREGKPRFVAGSIGPTTKLPTLGQVDFDRLQADFALQARGLMDGGADLLLLETCQDMLQIKAGLQGLEEAMAAAGRRLPIMVSVTMETTGAMLVGADAAAVVTILEPFPIDVLGLNCATGPDLMKPHVRYFSEQSPFVISCIPNAGLPENVGGVAHYRLTPMEMRMALHHFIEDLGVQIIGGCCGATPAHIEALVQHCQQLQPAPRPVRQGGNNGTSPSGYQPAAASIYTNTTYHQDNSFLIIGERLNASGSKKVRELLNQDDWDGLVSIGRQQVNENAHLLDVNVDFVGRDGVSDMKALVQRLVTNVNLPLMLDSTEWQKMEAGLKVAGGKCILNSTNYEDGEPRFHKVLELALRFGAGVVVGAIDEEGMARTAEKKLAIAQRAYRDALAYGLPPRELFFDPLALPISTGVEEDRRNAAATLEAIGRIRQQMPEAHVVLGISNVSFGLSPATRMALNSVFLHDCCSAGLDAAIVSPIKILPLNKINQEQQDVCRDLIHDRRRFSGDVCTYDPLTALTEMFAGVSGQAARATGPGLADLPVEERLKQHIIDGERLNLEDSLELALQTTPPLEIVNRFLLDGMKVVGELFGSGQMQLPFVLQSAQTMKAAVAYLEPHMEKTEGRNQARGKVLIATVKGDVHDIGKNLVDIILTNNGYEVINLGIKQDVTAIINAQQEHQADCICMSGLLVKSTAFMKDNLAAFNDAGIQAPVILGGAALTPRFVHRDCRAVYRGQVIYGKDAFTDLRFMDAYLKAREAHRWDHRQGFLDGIPPGVGLVAEDATAQPDQGAPPSGATASGNNATAEPTAKASTDRSAVVPAEPAVQPPFRGARLLHSHDVPLEEVAGYLDRQALFVGQWQLRRGKDQSKADHEDLLRTTAEPTLTHWLERCRQERLLQPAVAYGYFPCGRRGNSVQVFAPQGQERLGEFVFPRQRSGNRYCIADFYRDLVDDQPTDVLPMQAVTMGEQASLFAQELFQSHAYSDYLYFHGLAVQMAEALAEWIHARIRRACGFGGQEPEVLRDVLAQRYRGSRYSFGYPACPNVADSRQQLTWLGAEAIGLTMDSSDQLQPEQSTTALVALHSKARYFSA